MSKQNLDKFWIGFVVGLLGALFGFFAFGWFWALSEGVTFSYFFNDVFIGTGFFQDKIVTISILFDVVLFYFFMRANWLNMCKGILGVVVLSVPVAVWLY